MTSNDDARSMLEELKKTNFQISENINVSVLFEKLLLEPLSRVQKDIYFILDGLDEADISTVDKMDLHWPLRNEDFALHSSPTSSTRYVLVSRPDISILFLTAPT